MLPSKGGQWEFCNGLSIRKAMNRESSGFSVELGI